MLIRVKTYIYKTGHFNFLHPWINAANTYTQETEQYVHCFSSLTYSINMNVEEVNLTLVREWNFTFPSTGYHSDLKNYSKCNKPNSLNMCSLFHGNSEPTISVLTLSSHQSHTQLLILTVRINFMPTAYCRRRNGHGCY